METKSELKDWLPSNYPIFLALILLATTAVTLSMGDESRAESLATYAYYFLVIGIVIRFFELALPDSILQRLGMAKMCALDWLERHALERAKLGKILVPIAEVSKNVTILLSIFFLTSLIYGLIIDLQFVEKYIYNLVLIILYSLVLHFFTRAGFRRMKN